MINNNGEDDLVDEKVKIRLSRGGTIERILRNDEKGLHIFFNDERINVTPETNFFDEKIRGYYKGLHPKDAERMNHKKLFHGRE